MLPVTRTWLFAALWPLIATQAFRVGCDCGGRPPVATCAAADCPDASTDGGLGPGSDSGSPGDDGGTDAGLDAGDDGGTDAGQDAGDDGGADAGLDAGADGGVDAGLDAGDDGGTDAGPDAGYDGGTDAGQDAGGDGGADAGLDDGGVLTSALGSQGTHLGTQWDAVNSWVELDGVSRYLGEFPDGSGSTGWFDMTGDVLLFHLNETSGNAQDASGNGNTGILEDTVTRNQPGQIARSMQFDGVLDDIRVVNSPSITAVQTSGVMSVSLWAKYTDTVHDQQAWAALYYNSQNYFKLWRNGGSIAVWTSVNGITSGMNTATPLADTAWHHLVWVVNGTTTSVYLDGRHLMTGTVANPFSAMTVSPGMFFANSDGTAGDEYFGYLDEVAVWNRALGPDEVARIYQEQSAAYSGHYTSQLFDVGTTAQWTKLDWTTQRPALKAVPPTTETAYPAGNLSAASLGAVWHLDDAAGAVADSSGRGKTGTPVGSLVYAANGRFGGAVSFDGSSAYVSFVTPLLATVDPEPFTVSFWMRAARLQDATPWSLTDQTAPATDFDRCYGIDLGATGNVKAHKEGSGISATAYQPGRWHQVVGVFTSLSSRTTYLDGSGAATDTQARDTLLSVLDDFYLGARAFLPVDRYFSGALDEVVVWNRALSSAEVVDVYTRGALRLRFQVRACAAPCTAEAWLGPDGTSGSTYSELMNPTAGLPNLTLTGPPTGRYFQYRAFFDTLDPTRSPELKDVRVEYSP